MLNLDSTLALTHGNPLGLFAVLTHLDPTNGSYTAIFAPEDRMEPFLGQIRNPSGSRIAHMTFLAPQNTLNVIALPGLLDHLASEAGELGAMYLMAEIDERSTFFETFRRSGFSTYTWQRIWRYLQLPPETDRSVHWRFATDIDTVSIRGLIQSLVPPLIQPVEPSLESRPTGMLYRRSDQILAYAELTYGPHGICVQPFIHPTTENVYELIVDLLHSIPYQHGRPIFIIVRSYQGWLETILEQFSTEISSRQAVMVKHLAISQRVLQTLRLPSIENGHVEPSTPFARSKFQQK